jgi:histidinol-phosphatase (PHP family)
MAFLSNMHTHSTYSDGTSTLEDYVEAALERGFVSLGFSEHAPTTYCTCEISPQYIPGYFREIARLKKKYRGQIELYRGIEYDCFEWVDYYDYCIDKIFRREIYRLDYLIGSVHYLTLQSGKRAPVDNTAEIMQNIIDDYGGAEPMVREYYRLVCDVATRLKPDILAHFDLVTKLNADGCFFDENSAWYRGILDDAIEQVAMSGVIVEVNTGAMSRGFRDVPYPSEYILRGLYALGVPVTISSDAHSTDALDYGFDKAIELLRNVGYKTAKQFLGGRFIDVSI